ncbi:MAG: hypothetical protein Q7K39_01560 [Candidatus Magasanikbacteria bacterium]|nr:hypothetical protein [Candidatus Magasanikbacteria bacterium]
MDETKSAIDHEPAEPHFTFGIKIIQESLPVKRGYKDDFVVYAIDFNEGSPGTAEEKRLFKEVVRELFPKILLQSAHRRSGLYDSRAAEEAVAEAEGKKMVAILSDTDFQRKCISFYNELLAMRREVAGKLR